jgi:hypothetical protein
MTDKPGCTCKETGWYKCPIHSAIPEGTPGIFMTPELIVGHLLDALNKNTLGIRDVIRSVANDPEVR